MIADFKNGGPKLRHIGSFDSSLNVRSNAEYPPQLLALAQADSHRAGPLAIWMEEVGRCRHFGTRWRS